MQQQHSTSVYRRGADDGFIMGVYLSVWIILVCSSIYYQITGIIGLILSAGVPALLYVMLRRSYVKDFGLSTFSFLWLQGIVTFVCGTLMMAVVAFIFMRFIRPDYISELFSMVADQYESLPSAEAQSFAHNLHLMVKNNTLPTPIYVALELMMSGIFTGSILSMFITWLVRLRKVRSSLDTNI